MSQVTIYIEPNTGKEYAYLPNPWKGKVSPLTPNNCQTFGWVISSKEVEDPTPVYQYSKLKLMRACKDAGIWDSVKAKIEEAGYYDEFICAQDLSSDDERFEAVVATAKEAYGEETVNTILQKALL